MNTITTLHNDHNHKAEVERKLPAEFLFKKVTFDSQVTIIYEPEDLAQALRESRQGVWQHRQANQLRQEQLLGPILSKHHRALIQLRNLTLTNNL